MNPENAQEPNETDNMGNEANTQLLELQGALTEALTNMGLMGKLKAQLRAVSLGLFRGDPNLSLAAVGPTKSFADASIETQISFLLIKEFLSNNHLTQTAGVLEAEVGTLSCSNCAEEQVRSNIATLPGEGTTLERLIHFAINTDPSFKSHLSAPPSTTLLTSALEPTPALALDKISVDIEEDNKALLEPSSSNIHNELMQYEESIPYSDAEESLNEGLYVEVELL